MKKITTTTTVVTEEVEGKGVLACYILDMSGSMMGLTEQVISGFNEWLESVKAAKAVDYVTLSVFNDKVEFIYTAQPISSVRPLTRETYRPDGWTALHDGIVETIKNSETSARKLDINKALVIIMTDGAENSSKFNKLNDVRELITRKENEGNWTFTFLGATPDAFNVGSSFGIARGNIQRYEVEHSKGVFGGLATNSIAYSAAPVMKSRSFLENMDSKGNVGDYPDSKAAEDLFGGEQDNG